MQVQIGNNTFRVQFIKEVEQRRKGTTITTICKIFQQAGTKEILLNGIDCHIAWAALLDVPEKIIIVPNWVDVALGRARQNPRDKYNHIIGKRVALQNALGHTTFDRVERCSFAIALEAEFA